MSCFSVGGNLTSSISDHYFQFSQIDIFWTKKQKKIVKYARNFRNFNKREFTEELSKIEWSDITHNNDNIGTNDLYNSSDYRIENLLNEMAPYRKMTKNDLRLEEKPWITQGILVSMYKRDKLYKSMSREKDPHQKSEADKTYKCYRN